MIFVLSVEPAEVRVELEPDGTLRPTGLQSGQAYRVVVIPASVRWTPSPQLRCETDSPGPTPLEPGQTLFAALAGAARAATDAGGRLVILGHASPVGGVSHNADLSEARAKSVASWLTGHAKTWVDVMTERGSPADVQRWLRHWALTLGWPVDPMRTDGVLDTESERAVRRFQEEVAQRFSIDVETDGRITRGTLEAAFAVGRRELERHLADAELRLEDVGALLQPQDILGCGARFAEDERLVRRCGSSAEEQQRVDVIVVPPTCRWGAEHGAEALLLFTRQEPYPNAGDAPRAGQLSVRLRDRHGRALVGAGYTLWVGDTARTGSTDPQGNIVEEGVDGSHLKLELDSGELIVFDHLYSEALPFRTIEPTASIDHAADLETPLDDALPALYEDDEGEDA